MGWWGCPVAGSLKAARCATGNGGAHCVREAGDGVATAAALPGSAEGKSDFKFQGFQRWQLSSVA